MLQATGKPQCKFYIIANESHTRVCFLISHLDSFSFCSAQHYTTSQKGEQPISCWRGAPSITLRLSLETLGKTEYCLKDVYAKFERSSPTFDFLTKIFTFMMAGHYLQILIRLTSWRSSKIRSLSGGFRISSEWRRFSHWRTIIRSHLQISTFNVFANNDFLPMLYQSYNYFSVAAKFNQNLTMKMIMITFIIVKTENHND